MFKTVTAAFCMFKDNNASRICFTVRDIAGDIRKNPCSADICFTLCVGISFIQDKQLKMQDRIIFDTDIYILCVIFRCTAFCKRISSEYISVYLNQMGLTNFAKEIIIYIGEAAES